MWVRVCGWASVCRQVKTGDVPGRETGEKVPSRLVQMVPAGLQNQSFKGAPWKPPAPPHIPTSANEALTQSHEEKRCLAEPLGCTPEVNIILYDNHTSI